MIPKSYTFKDRKSTDLGGGSQNFKIRKSTSEFINAGVNKE